MEQSYQAVKYLYWKKMKFNLIVYAQPEQVVAQSKYTTKRDWNKRKVFPLPPEKYRLAKEDVYYEDPQDAQKMILQRKEWIQKMLNENLKENEEKRKMDKDDSQLRFIRDKSVKVKLNEFELKKMLGEGQSAKVYAV